MFEVEITRQALGDLHYLTKRARRIVVARLEEHLTHEPARETRNRKRLRPNQLAEWELRIDRFRVFFDVDSVARVVRVMAVGRKEGNRLFIRDEEYQL
jgi:mRNA-degrading endonuclease RelE of RelBE toxin-antitoxin system